MPSCPGLTPKLHSTIDLIAGSVEHPPLHQLKASCGEHLHFKERTFSKSVNTFDNNHMRCLFFIWWHLPTLKWTGATLCTLTMDIMWLLILILTCFCCLLPVSVIAQLDLFLAAWKLLSYKWLLKLLLLLQLSPTTIWGPWIRYPQYED